MKGKACLEQDKANTRLVGEVGGRQIEDRMHGVMDGPEILLAFISSADSPDTDT